MEIGVREVPEGVGAPFAMALELVHGPDLRCVLHHFSRRTRWDWVAPCLLVLHFPASDRISSLSRWAILPGAVKSAPLLFGCPAWELDNCYKQRMAPAQISCPRYRRFARSRLVFGPKAAASMQSARSTCMHLRRTIFPLASALVVAESQATSDKRSVLRVASSLHVGLK